MLKGRWALLALAAIACGGDCPSCPADDGLDIDVRQLDAWPDGLWVFRFEADGASARCTADIPWTEGHGIECHGIGGCQFGTVDADPDKHGVCGFHYDWTPLQVDVSVEHEGEIVLEQTFDPSYHTLQGREVDGCTPCTSEVGAIQLDLP